MWTTQPEHSTENWNVICSLKSLCTQQIVGLDVFSTSVMWVSLVDSVQQSLIRVCPFLYRFWSKMNLCACFSSYQSVMKLLLQCCGGSGAVATEQCKWGAGLTCQGLLGRAHCPQLLGFERCAAQLRLSWICRIHLKKHLRFPWWCSEPKELPCHVPRSWAGAGWQVGGTAGRRQTAFSSLLSQAGGLGRLTMQKLRWCWDIALPWTCFCILCNAEWL